LHTAVCDIQVINAWVAQQQVQHRTAPLNLLFHQMRFQAKSLPALCTTARPRQLSSINGNTDNALIADYGDLSRGAILHDTARR
jgi:hypothetical protein